MSDFTWKGTKASTKYIVVSEYPPIVRPEQRIESVQIPGRSGEVYLSQDGTTYNSYTKDCICYIADPTKLAAAAAWLTGSGDVVFDNESTYAYEARIAYQIPFEKIMRGRPHQRFVVPFKVQPLKKAATTENNITVTVSGTVVNNIGHVPSRPLIKVTGSGDVVLTVGTTVTNITGISTSITLDTDAGMALDNTLLVNASAQVSGAWPVLAVGNNAVSWTGTVTSVLITPRWRYL